MVEESEHDPSEPWPGALEDHRPQPRGWVRSVPRTQQLCQALAAAVELDGAAVAMITKAGERDLVHATDPVIGHLDELQFTLAEGPCLDAHATGAPVLAHDLTDTGSRARWPVFALEASAAGAAAAFAFPMVSAEVGFGVLELYRRTPGPLGAADLETVLAAVEAVTRVALDELFGSPATEAHPHSWPGRLSTAHAGVHQAAGMVAVHLGVSIPDAMARLRAAAYSQGTSLAELADRVLTGTTRLDKDAPR
jgi:hypothetical protein